MSNKPATNRLTHCVRTSRDDERHLELREADRVEQWLAFNRDFRPDNALFVDGECRATGDLRKETCAAIAAELCAKMGAIAA